MARERTRLGSSREEEKPAERTRTRERSGGGKEETKSLIHSGDEIFDRAEAEEKKREEAARRREEGIYMPFRFWVPEGETREVVILDAKIQDGRQFYEHNLKIDNKWGNFELCYQEVTNCPVCAKYPDNKPYFVVVFTVLDLTPFTTKKGVKVEFSRKLMALKSSSLASFKDIQDAAIDAHGTLRGTYLQLHRPKASGQNTPNVGAPKVLKGGIMFEHYNEKEMVAEWGTPARKDPKTGKVLAVANSEIQPFDYDKLFPQPTEEDIEELRERFNLGATPGSRREAIDEWEKKEEDGGDAEEEAAPQARTRSRVRQEPEPEPAPTRRRSRAGL